MKNLIPLFAGLAIASATIVTAQSSDKGQRVQTGGGIAKLLGKAGATEEQIKQFNDARLELRNSPNYRTALQAELEDILTKEQFKEIEEVWRNRGRNESNNISAAAPVDANQWKTAGLQQANSMGGGAAEIPKSGKFRVFVLMGQSNMTGAARAKELKSPYTEKHDRIRIWANGRWEYFVPSVRFGPGVSMAHQLAEHWPEDTIGIIKVASGGTGIRGFEKSWSFERSNLTFDGKKGSLYQDLMNAVAEAKRISKPEFCGFVWKQGAADGTKKVLADEYYDTFKQLVSDLRRDLGVPDLPVFMPSYMNDEELLKAVLPHLSDEEFRTIKNPAGKPSVKDADLLEAVLTYLSETNSHEFRKAAGKRPYIATVVAAQNRAGRELTNVTTIYPGELPRIGGGNNHINAEGQIKLGKMTASAVEEFYKSKL